MMVKETILMAFSGTYPFESDFLNTHLKEHSNHYLIWFGRVEDIKISPLSGYSEVVAGGGPIKLFKFISCRDISKVVLFDYNPFLTIEMLKLVKSLTVVNIIVARRNERI